LGDFLGSISFTSLKKYWFEMNYYTYMITRVVPGLPVKYYIGVRQSECEPVQDVEYWGSSKYLDAEREKHGKQYFKKCVLASFSTAEEAADNEVFLHQLFNVKDNPRFFNRANATKNGFAVMCGSPSLESRRKMSEAKKGCKHPLYGLYGQNHPMYGYRHSEETKRKMSEDRRGRKHSVETCHKISVGLKGHAVSEATKEKLAEANRGKKLSKTTKQKISNAMSGTNNPMYGKRHRQDTKQKIAETKTNKHITSEGVGRLREAGYSIQDVADLLGCGKSTVKARYRLYKQNKI